VTEVPLALALSAGMLAAVNPCGFALLPVYLSLLVVGDDAPGRAVAVRRAVTATAAMTVGFAGVFAAFGLLIAPVAGTLQEHLPWFTLVLGLTLAAVGGWLAAGRQLPVLRLPGGRRAAVSRSGRSMVLFGAAYALASLGCTIGPFLAIVVSSFRAGSVGAGVALFLTYALGMGLLVGVAALAVALARTSVITRLRRAGLALTRAGGVVLLVAGAYVAYYGWYELRLLRGDIVDDPVVSAAGTVQRWLADGVDRIGVPVLSVAFVLLLVGASLAGRARRRRVARSS
jgi:cytochrome c biogenesis protein CcdA